MSESVPLTLLDKIWQAHLVEQREASLKTEACAGLVEVRLP
jgi:hypothetical protein